MKKVLILAISMAFVCVIFFTPVCATEVDSSVCAGSIDLRSITNNPDVIISEVMSYEEMIRHYAQNEGIAYSEATRRLASASDEGSTRDLTYRTFSVILNVTDTYKPSLHFYCETAEGGHFFNINSIYSVQLVRSYGSISKQFGGDIDVWLRSTQSIEYVVNGDFYNNGTTTVTGGGGLDIGLNESSKISFSASLATTSNHYKYFYKHDTMIFVQ